MTTLEAEWCAFWRRLEAENALLRALLACGLPLERIERALAKG